MLGFGKPRNHYSNTPYSISYTMTTDDGIKFVDTTIRDGHQSLWAENMTTGMMLPVAERMDRAGFGAIELISSSHLKKCVRELKEDHGRGAPRRARFSLDALHSVSRFAAGMLGINFLALLLTQADKVILSRLLPLQDYGYYMLAATVTGLMFTFVMPITQAVYPAMVEHIAADGRMRSPGLFMAAPRSPAPFSGPPASCSSSCPCRSSSSGPATWRSRMPPGRWWRSLPSARCSTS